MAKEEFGGDKKEGRSILMGAEDRFKHWAVPRLPGWIETNHLTMMTLIWAAVNVLAAFLVVRTGNRTWLALVAAMIVLQYVTDLFDGELGRQRDTGLVKWGYHMDHFLDYIFLCSLVFVAYKLAPGIRRDWYFVLLVVLGGFMVNSYLAFGATNRFQIYHYGIGPTETRLAMVVFIIYVIVGGTGALEWVIPLLVGACTLGLVINTWQTQRTLWKIDMEAKATRSEKERQEP
jgi:phosphatidylglycerophosphate synthase